MRFYDYLARIINVEVQELPFGITRFDSGRGVDAGGHCWIVVTETQFYLSYIITLFLFIETRVQGTNNVQSS